MKQVKTIAISVIAVFCTSAMYAQTPVVTARVEPDSIGIGDRFTYTIDVDKDLVQVVLFPEFSGDEKNGMEIVRELPVDTLARDGRRLKLRKQYVLAAFEEGNYALGKAQVLYADKNIVDTLSSRDSMYLRVGTFQIDSTSQSVYDIKAQKQLPFRFVEIAGYVKWGVIILLLLVLALYAAKRIMARYGKRLGDIFRPAPPLPPHVAAIKALEELHNQKLWQNNKHKLYYSGITDILRTYIEQRYGVSAMEMTSDEIIIAMKTVDIPKKNGMDLASILRESDLVKFAKAVPDAEDNEAAYYKAYYFVEETKVQDQNEGEGDETKVKIDR